MNEKSHVSLERHVCLVCGIAYDTGSILLDRRLRASLEHYTTTGWGLCPEHEKLFATGYVALVECDPERSSMRSGADRVMPELAYRTGQIAHLKREMFNKVFDVPISADQACVFVELGVIEQLQAMAEPTSD